MSVDVKPGESTWGMVLILVHWVTFLLVFGLYVLGLYMVELDYYDPWYRSAPFWHKSLGLCVFALVVCRIFWRLSNKSPAKIFSHRDWERVLAKLVHLALYALLIAICISGYFISTADGRSISFFGWFDIPAVLEGVDNLEDIAGEVHELSTTLVVYLVALHAIGALKHHFMDRDDTLKRMLFGSVRR